MELDSSGIEFRRQCRHFPLQDILGLGTETRMNLPGTAQGNWGWRYHPDQLTPGLAGHLSFITELYGRRIYHSDPAPEVWE